MREIRPVSVSLVASQIQLFAVKLRLSNVGRLHFAAHLLRSEDAVVVGGAVGVFIAVRREAFAASVVAARTAAVVVLGGRHVQAERAIPRRHLSILHRPTVDGALRIAADVRHHHVVVLRRRRNRSWRRLNDCRRTAAHASRLLVEGERESAGELSESGDD